MSRSRISFVGNTRGIGMASQALKVQWLIETNSKTGSDLPIEDKPR